MADNGLFVFESFVSKEGGRVASAKSENKELGGVRIVYESVGSQRCCLNDCSRNARCVWVSCSFARSWMRSQAPETTLKEARMWSA